MAKSGRFGRRVRRLRNPTGRASNPCRVQDYRCCTEGPGREAAGTDHRWDPPRYEIALQGGNLHYPTKQLEGVAVLLTSPNPELPPYAIGLSDDIDDGWSAGLSVTMNTWRWVSSEFGYHIRRGKYRLEQFDIPGNIDEGLGYETYGVGLATRQFEYNLLVHARPRESRWRPYVAAGPALQ